MKQKLLDLWNTLKKNSIFWAVIIGLGLFGLGYYLGFHRGPVRVEEHTKTVEDTVTKQKLEQVTQQVQTLTRDLTIAQTSVTEYKKQLTIAKKTISELKKHQVTVVHTVTNPDGTTTTDSTTTTDTTHNSTNTTDATNNTTNNTNTSSNTTDNTHSTNNTNTSTSVTTDTTTHKEVETSLLKVWDKAPHWQVSAFGTLELIAPPNPTNFNQVTPLLLYGAGAGYRFWGPFWFDLSGGGSKDMRSGNSGWWIGTTLRGTFTF